MNKFNQALSEVFSAEINGDEFKPQATYYDCMDYVEYLSSSSLTISDRVDDFLTLLWDSSCENVVGFRIKGFRCLFNTKLKPLFDFTDNDFLPLISVIQAVVEKVGKELTNNADLANAYRKAYLLAMRGNVKLYDVPFRDAA